jgi:protein TonB
MTLGTIEAMVARGPGPSASEQRRRLPPALLVLAALGALVLVVGFAVFVLQWRRGKEGPPTEALGSEVPRSWVPGEGGAGQPPPTPAGEPLAEAAGKPAVVPELPPYEPTDTSLPPPGSDEELRALPPVLPPLAAVPPPEAVPPLPGEAEAAFEPPRLLSMPAAAYPRMARRARVEGTVTLRVRVDRAGRVLEAEPLGEPAGYGLEGEARRVAMRARFAPALRDGVPVVADSRVAVTFRLD